MSEVTIQELVRIHDDEPQTVAAALRTLARTRAPCRRRIRGSSPGSSTT